MKTIVTRIARVVSFDDFEDWGDLESYLQRSVEWSVRGLDAHPYVKSVLDQECNTETVGLSVSFYVDVDFDYTNYQLAEFTADVAKTILGEMKWHFASDSDHDIIDTPYQTTWEIYESPCVDPCEHAPKVKVVFQENSMSFWGEDL